MATLSTVDILERLVAFPTVSRDPNLALIDWVRNYLASHGVRSHLVPDSTGHKANLFASVGPLAEGGLVLSGHTDVVPIDGQSWTTDPFTLTARGSRLHARGACDMKGFIASALSRVPGWCTSKLSRPVHLMLSYDEELGCLGAPSMIAAAEHALPAPAVVIVGEPTSMRIATEHKSIRTLCTHVKGVEAHSSLTHRGMSAVMLAGDLVAHLGELARQFAAHGLPGARRFEPPYTTLSVNRIEGGTALNILAAECEFLWEIRAVPGETPKMIVDRLASFVDTYLASLEKEGKLCAVETSVQADVPALHADGGAAEKLVRAVMPSAGETIAVPFATEGGQFQRAGWSTVVCGPGRIEQAHKPNEFVEESELTACDALLDRLVAHHCR